MEVIGHVYLKDNSPSLKSFKNGAFIQNPSYSLDCHLQIPQTSEIKALFSLASRSNTDDMPITETQASEILKIRIVSVAQDD